MQFVVWVTSDGVKKLSCDRLPALRERLQVILVPRDSVSFGHVVGETD